MRKTAMISVLTAAVVALSACEPKSSESTAVSYPIISTEGAEIGKLAITPLTGGGVELNVSVSGLEPGMRAMHIHEVGSCLTPDFKSAGGHYNPEGVEHGQHAGDMMNVDVAADGTGKFVIVNPNVNLSGGDLPQLKDADGSALIIHGGADDYTSQPSGAAGPRVACAVIPAG